MATVTKKNARNLPLPGFGGVPYGNLSVLSYKYETNSSGIFVDSDKATAVADGDVVILGVLPAGFSPVDILMNVRDAFASSTTAKIGFKYCDGVDVTAVPEDDDYFITANATSAQAIVRKTAYTGKITLPKDAWLILTRAGANDSAAGIADIDVIGVLNGAP